MKKTLLLSIICCSFCITETIGQREKLSGDPHRVERFFIEAQKSNAYASFRVQLDALIKKSKGKNTNAVAVKKLFSENKALLSGLYSKAGIEEPLTTMSGKRHIKGSQSIFAMKNSILKNLGMAGMTTTQFPPFENIWKSVGSPIANDPAPFDTTGSSLGSGKFVFTVKPSNLPNKIYLGIYATGFTEKIIISNNPQVLAAKVKFDYSFTYDGWDTYGSKAAVDLLLRTSTNFNSSAYNALPGTSSFYTTPNDRWKTIATLLPLDSVTTDFGEIHATADSSFTLEGYVVPGSEVEFKFGITYPSDTHRGLNGCYHYGEFILKKITVSYYKSSN